MSELIERQAAIDAINSWRGRFSEEYNEAIDDCENSIKELPPAQPEPCGDKSYALWKESYEELKRRMDELTACSDTISRRATIDAVNNAFDRETLLTVFVRSIALRAIRDMPSVQPEPQEGHWIPHESPDGGEQYECSRCGVLWEFTDGTPDDNEAYFCPNCGAKMTISTK